MVSWNVNSLTPDWKAWREQARQLAEAGVNSVTLFWFGEGEHYRHILFDSAIYEITHPAFGFEKVYEVLTRLCALCHEVGIRVIAHHGFAFVHYQLAHPFYQVDIDRLFYEGEAMSDWLGVDMRTGGPTLGQYNGYVFCPNRPSFRKAVRHLVGRLVGCGVDGLMLDDISFMPSYYVCGCEVCRAGFARRGGSLPPVGDTAFWGNFENPQFRAWLDFRMHSTADFHREQAEAIAGIRREFFYDACNSTNLLVAASQNQGWGYERWMEAANVVHRENCNWRVNAFSWVDAAVEEKVNHALARPTGAPCLSLIYPHSPDDYFNAWAQTMVSGSHFWGGYQHYHWQSSASGPRTVRTPPGRVQEAIGSCYRWEIAYPAFFPRSSTALSAIAVVFSPSTRLFYGGNDDGYYGHEFSGWCQMLLRAGEPFNVVLEEEMGSEPAAQVKLLILPNWACMSEAAAAAVRRFVKRGGRVIATGETGFYDAGGALRATPLLADLFGFELRERRPEAPGVVLPDPKGRCAGDEPFQWVRGRVVLVDPLPAARLEARYAGPVVQNQLPFPPGENRLPHDRLGAVLSHTAGGGECFWFGLMPGRMIYTSWVASLVDFGRPPLTFAEMPDGGMERFMRRVVSLLEPASPVRVRGAKGWAINAFSVADGVVVHLLNQSAFQWRGGGRLREEECDRFPYPPLEEELVVSLAGWECGGEVERLDLPQGRLETMPCDAGRVVFAKGEPLIYTILFFRKTGVG